MPPTDNAILTAAAVAEMVRDADCSNCKPEELDVDLIVRDHIPSLAASHEALRAEVEKLTKHSAELLNAWKENDYGARCFDALAEFLGVDSTEPRFWKDENTKDFDAIMTAANDRLERLRDCERVAWAKTMPGWNIELGHPPEGFRYYLTKPLEQIAIIIGADYWTWSDEARAAIDAARKGAHNADP